MNIQETPVVLRKITAAEGKIIISKSVDDNGNPVIKSKEIYLPENANIEDFEEIDYVEENQETNNENEEVEAE